ncbi:MAG: hypothetical protein HRU20_14605 [Pseudomonadales bacterium]|nr:hypothetical protein [Pseudomonadales bacterium]
MTKKQPNAELMTSLKKSSESEYQFWKATLNNAEIYDLSALEGYRDKQGSRVDNPDAMFEQELAAQRRKIHTEQAKLRKNHYAGRQTKYTIDVWEVERLMELVSNPDQDIKEAFKSVADQYNRDEEWIVRISKRKSLSHFKASWSKIKKSNPTYADMRKLRCIPHTVITDIANSGLQSALKKLQERVQMYHMLKQSEERAHKLELRCADLEAKIKSVDESALHWQVVARNLRRDGMTLDAICKQVGKSKSTVQRALKA